MADLSIFVTDMCTNVTEKIQQSNIRNSRNFKITVIFDHTNKKKPLS